jgi:16S rRNA (uracil1498-N3)-methyltransferase
LARTDPGAHHFFVAPGDVHDGSVVIGGDEARHAARVLRVRPGEAVTVADGSGRVLEGVVAEVGEVVRAEVRSIRETEIPKPHIVLCQAVAKGDRMDDVVTKAVEIGVGEIVPFIAERTVVRWDASKRSRACERWTAVARAAAKQCRSPRLTAVGNVRDGVPDAFDSGSIVLVLHEGAERPMRETLPDAAPDQVVLIVGPEGGLSPAEVQTLTRRGGSAVTLGDRILRTETAGLVAATIIRYTYGSLG